MVVEPAPSYATIPSPKGKGRGHRGTVGSLNKDLKNIYYIYIL